MVPQRSGIEHDPGRFGDRSAKAAREGHRRRLKKSHSGERPPPPDTIQPRGETIVAMESTVLYWRPVYAVLELRIRGDVTVLHGEWAERRLKSAAVRCSGDCTRTEEALALYRWLAMQHPQHPLVRRGHRRSAWPSESMSCSRRAGALNPLSEPRE